jgi:hypothetical protein
MEYLLLLFVVPVLWLLFVPRRVLNRAGDWPLFKPAIVGVVVLLGWMLYAGFNRDPADLSAVPDADKPIERRVNQTQDYARGDDQLRMMLSQ